ncbi:hypothetical protein QLR68_29320, partial [Micromonospora sp. DH15]|nr:hypothetical protein [Micromonospora sp. DH15]
MSDTLATGTARTDRERVLGRRRERVGPGGDPVAPAPAPPDDPDGQAEGEQPTGGGVVLDCGWGRLVFGQTFSEQAAVAAVLRSEAAGARDICIYLRDPHVLVSRLPDELFIDPSLTYRLRLPAAPAAADDRDGLPGLRIRTLRDADDADAVNRIYARNGMVTAPVDVLVDNARTERFLHLVAEDASSVSSAWPVPGGAVLKSTVRHHRLAPLSGSAKTATWSTPVIVPTTSPVASW